MVLDREFLIPCPPRMTLAMNSSPINMLPIPCTKHVSVGPSACGAGLLLQQCIKRVELGTQQPKSYFSKYRRLQYWRHRCLTSSTEVLVILFWQSPDFKALTHGHTLSKGGYWLSSKSPGLAEREQARQEWNQQNLMSTPFPVWCL